MVGIGLVLAFNFVVLCGAVWLAHRRGWTGATALMRVLAVVAVVASILVLAFPAQAAEGGLLVELPKWTPTILGLGSLGLAVLVLYLSTRFVLKADHKETIERLSKVEERLATVESKVGALPDKAQIHQLTVDLERTNGEIKALSAAIKPMSVSLSRIENWLIDRGGKS